MTINGVDPIEELHRLKALLDTPPSESHTLADPADGGDLAIQVLGWLEQVRLRDGQWAAAMETAPARAPTSAAPAQVEVLTSTLGSLRKLLEAREADIARLRAGGDAMMFRRFLAGFIRAHQAATEVPLTGAADAGARLTVVGELIEDALDACGVSLFTPKVGSDYRRAFGVATPPELLPCETPDQAFAIAAVLQRGYSLTTPEGDIVLIPAKVQVYGTTED